MTVQKAARIWLLALLASGLPLRAQEPAPLPLPLAATSEMRAFAQQAAVGSLDDRVHSLVDLLFDQNQGLGFRYQRRPTRSAAEAFEDRLGNCLSMVNLFVTLAREAGVKAQFVEVEDHEMFYRDSGTVLRSDHIVAGVRVGGELVTVDFLPNRAKRYRVLRPIGDARARAHYYKAIATEALIDGKLPASQRAFDRALEVDPTFAETWNNLAILQKRTGDGPASLSSLERALEIDPNLLPALENLSSHYRRTAQPERAQELEARIASLHNRNPYYLLSRGLRLLEEGEYRTARATLRQARRIDKTIPDVYLALGRAELGLGRRNRAENLFANARRRNKVLSEHLDSALQDKIDQLLAGGG